MDNGGAFIFFVFAGLFPIAAAVFDWDFFFDNYKARPLVKLLGRDGARIFYGVLGFVLIFAGILLMTAGYEF